jgi:hypothetical protein
VTGEFELHYVFGYDYGTPPNHGLVLNTWWNAKGVCYGEVIDECVIGYNGWQRILVTKTGSGKVYFLKYHYWFTFNTCTGETLIKFSDWVVECD